MKRNILIVDDEMPIREAFHKLFDSTGDNIFTAASGKEALELLDQHPIDLLVTDMRMPEMDGTMLLKIVKDRYPAIVRIILSYLVDEPAVLKALQENLAKLYLFKPLKDHEIVRIIEQVFETEQEMKNMNLFETIINANDLPTMTSTYQKLCTLIENDATIDDISYVVEKDPSVASRVLRIANSAFYGMKTGSIRQSIMYLGLLNVRSIVLTSSLFENAFPKAPKPIADVMDTLWKHCNNTSRVLVQIYQNLLGRKISPDLLSAGILHDVGKIMLLNNQPAKFLALTKENRDIGCAFSGEKEQEAFGLSHNDVGGFLLHWWELPYAIVEAARFHHNPQDPRIINKELVCALHLADTFSWRLSNPKAEIQYDPSAFAYLDTTEEAILRMLHP